MVLLSCVAPPPDERPLRSAGTSFRLTGLVFGQMPLVFSLIAACAGATRPEAVFNSPRAASAL
ncbi:MAG TPA: hypothetical protein DEQ98_04415 [Acidobacteria bacterium]|nr:hypothetical protein [Acidobacteriota bacterium]